VGRRPETPCGCTPVTKVVSRFSDHLTSRNLNWRVQTGICRSLIILVRPNAWVQPVILIRPNCFWRALINSRLNFSQAVSVLTVKSTKPYWSGAGSRHQSIAIRPDSVFSNDWPESAVKPSEGNNLCSVFRVLLEGDNNKKVLIGLWRHYLFKHDGVFVS
jgi:hypothetical protein